MNGLSQIGSSAMAPMAFTQARSRSTVGGVAPQTWAAQLKSVGPSETEHHDRPFEGYLDPILGIKTPHKTTCAPTWMLQLY